MRGEYVTATIRAEVKLARREGRPINRLHLRDETGLAWHSLERLISTAAQDLIHAEADPMPGPVGLKFWPVGWKGKP